MTLRTHRYFICPNGHQGTETISESDQPYGDIWETTTFEGMNENVGKDGYVCTTCGAEMSKRLTTR